MADYKCSACGEFTFFGSHTCPPKWWVIHNDDEKINGEYIEENGQAIYAGDAKKAAIKWAEANYAYYEYPSQMDVIVMSDKHAWDAKKVSIEKFTLGVEAVPSFYEEQHEISEIDISETVKDAEAEE